LEGYLLSTTSRFTRPHLHTTYYFLIAAFSTNFFTMYMLKSVVSVALFAAYTAAQAASGIAFTSLPTTIQAGEAYPIEWAGGDPTAVCVESSAGHGP
jgi:hypothetical protein